MLSSLPLEKGSKIVSLVIPCPLSLMVKESSFTIHSIKPFTDIASMLLLIKLEKTVFIKSGSTQTSRSPVNTNFISFCVLLLQVWILSSIKEEIIQSFLVIFLLERDNRLSDNLLSFLPSSLILSSDFCMVSASNDSDNSNSE